MIEIWYGLVCASCVVLSFLSLRPRFVPTTLLRILIIVEIFVLYGRALYYQAPELAASRGLPPMILVALPFALLIPFIVITAVHLSDEVKYRLAAPVASRVAAEAGSATPAGSEVTMQLETALRAFQKKLKRDPQDPEANFRAAQTLERLKRFPEAAAHFEAAVANFTDEARKVESALKAAEMMERIGKAGQAVMLLNGLRAAISNKVQRMMLEDKLKLYQQAQTFRGGWAGPTTALGTEPPASPR